MSAPPEKPAIARAAEALAPARADGMAAGLYELLLASVQDYAIFAVDAAGHVASWNAGAERLKGYPSSEVLGRHLSMFYPPEARGPDGVAPRVAELLATAAREGRAEDEAWRVRRDGTRFWANVVITPIRDASGTTIGFAKVTRDLTARVEDEARARELAAARAARTVAERDQVELQLLAQRLEEQASELEQQTEEAQALAEELEQANEQLQEAAREAEEARDVAEVARRAAEELEQRTRRIFDASPLPSWIVDLGTRRIVDVNDAAVARYGWSREEFARLTLADVREPEAHPALAEALRETAERGEWRGTTRHRTRDGERLDVEVSARLLSVDGRPAMLAVVGDVTARRRAEARQRFLVEATEALAASLDVETTIRQLVRLAVPTLADWAAYNVADGEHVRVVAIHHPDPAMERLAREIADRHPQRLDSGVAVAHVLVTGEPQFIPEIPDAVLRAAATDEAHYRALCSIGLRALINVPLVANGRVLGNLGFATGDSGRRLDEDDFALARELARRAALALDNAMHHAAERQARARAERGVARLERLQQLAAALSTAVDVDTVARRAVQEARAALGAAAAYVVRRTDDPETLEFVHGEGFPMPVAAAHQPFPLAARYPGAEVVRTGQALWFGAPAERERYFGEADTSPLSRAFAASATLPLAAEGVTTGSLGLHFDAPRAFDADDRAFLGALAEQVALAMERARLFDAERRARDAAARAQARAEFLAEVGQLLASSLDYDATLQALAQAVVPRLADWCAVDVVADGSAEAWPPVMRRLAVMHQDPAKVAWARAIHERYPTDWTQPRGLPRVLREGVTEFLAEVPDEVLVAAARSPEHLAMLRELGFRAVLVVPLRARGRVAGAITLVMAESGRHYDDDDRRLAEEVAHRASLAIEHAGLYREAQQANAAKMQFLATMSHELRTPLNAIGGYAQLLELGMHGPLSPEQREYVGRIERSQRHLLALIDDVLDVARIESGRTRYRVEHVPVAEVVEAVVTLVAPQAQARGLVLDGASCGHGTAVLADRERLQQVLLNLAANAVKFTPAGGRIAFACERRGDQVELSVADTGIGIPADRLSSIFEPFVQVDSGLTRTAGGTGLGLSISRDLARGMGGSLRVQSTLGEGSTFTLALPASDP